MLRLPDGRTVRGAGARRPRGGPDPELLVLLRGRRPAPPAVGEWRWIRWPDFGLPASDEDAIETLVAAHGRCVTMRVQVSCGGGVGRTGAALAVLAGLSGVPPRDAVAWVRTHYDPGAVETRRQRAWVERVLTGLLG